jgi:hypothetical protein
MHLGMCWIRLSVGISKYQQLKKKSAPTALNTVLASAARKQAIAKTPPKWSAYQIPSAIVVFVILVFKV